MPRTETIGFEHDGTYLEGYAKIPDGQGPFPVVVAIHGGSGMGISVPRPATSLAENGYVAVVADMIGAKAQKSSLEELRAAFAPFGNDKTLPCRRTAAWVDAAAAKPWAAPGRIAVIGYCFGGFCALELARSGADVKAAVSFHGMLNTRAVRAKPGGVKAYVAVYTGDKDSYVPFEQVLDLRQELTEGGGPFQITTFSEAGHVFTEPTDPEYDPLSDYLAWEAAMALLKKTLGDGARG
jgi:dienelactone hydrolase